MSRTLFPEDPGGPRASQQGDSSVGSTRFVLRNRGSDAASGFFILMNSVMDSVSNSSLAKLHHEAVLVDDLTLKKKRT